MSDESITLEPMSYDKLGSIHCGVTREGFVAVGGDTSDIDDGQEVIFDRLGIKATRNGSEYTFSKVT